MTKTYILTDSMRSTKTGFFIEGTDIAMDFPDIYPLPMQTEILEDGRPVALRLLPYCPYLEVEKQIKNGFPAHYVWNDTDRRKLSFKFRMLELDDQQDKIWVEYLERSAWKEGNEDKKPRQTTKTIFQAYDKEAIINAEIADETLIIRAKNVVLDLDDSPLRNLYRLANPGLKADSMVRVAAMRKYLLDLASINPPFILNGIKSNTDRIVVLVSRAIEARIISLEFPAQVCMFNESSNEYIKMISANDAGGQEEKFDRVVDYLLTEQGATDLAIIENKVANLPAEVVQ
jgi:hypothetical protein